MIKLDLSPSPFTHATEAETLSTQRLLVLVPSDTDYSAATRGIWELANATGMHVRLLSLCKDAAEEQSLHRKLIGMESLLQDGKVCVESKMMIGTNWVVAVKNMYEEGDVIVCFAEQRTGLWQRPLSQILESNIKATLYVLSNPSSQRNRSNEHSSAISWLGFIGIILGFGLLQTKVLQLPESSLQSILLILSILPEFWLIWIWNSLFG